MNMLAYEADTAWNRGIPCIFFKILIQLYYICYVHFFILWLIVSKRVSKIIIWRLNEKSVGLWGSYGQKQGNPLQFFKTLIKSYLFYELNILPTVSKRVSKLRNFGDELEKCRPLIQIFLYESWKKTIRKFCFDRWDNIHAWTCV